jgi:hypothetical protein
VVDETLCWLIEDWGVTWRYSPSSSHTISWKHSRGTCRGASCSATKNRANYLIMESLKIRGNLDLTQWKRVSNIPILVDSKPQSLPAPWLLSKLILTMCFRRVERFREKGNPPMKIICSVGLYAYSIQAACCQWINIFVISIICFGKLINHMAHTHTLNQNRFIGI